MFLHDNTAKVLCEFRNVSSTSLKNLTYFSFTKRFVEISPAEGVAPLFEMKPERLAKTNFYFYLYTKNRVKDSNSPKFLLKNIFTLLYPYERRAWWCVCKK